MQDDGHPPLPNPYIPNTDADRALMLQRLGVDSVERLFDVLPAEHRDPELDVPPALAEADLVRLLQARASENVAAKRPMFLGAGAYRRAIPAVTAHVASRSEFVTSYTPYQPEISQGTLQAGFEYQSVVCELTGLDVSNTGMYDAASATAEACLLAARSTGRKAVALLEPVHPHIVDVVRAYAYGVGLRVDTVQAAGDLSEEHAGLVVQQPDFLGGIRDLEPLAAAAHEAGALCIVVADPLALGLLRSPGESGADIVTGEGRDLAGPVAFGGPSLGLFAAREAFLRQMPGRIVGRAKELHPPHATSGAPETPDAEQAPARTGYVLTLQAREQFIRRERATSNFSTGQALIALAFTVTVQALGPRGLRESAELCYQRAHDAARRVASLPGYSVVDRGPWFQEFLVRGPVPAAVLGRALADRGITGGLDVSDRPELEARDATLFCVTEATPPEEVDALVQALQEIGAGS
ncbi:MAG: aminomethyl-transferring glycine dehydrogenase subunit GcvPA [Dehalococcoidia bacterium]